MGKIRKMISILRKEWKEYKKIKSTKEAVYIPVFQQDLLNGRCALITGGTSGIGEAIAEAFLASGAVVIITGRNTERLEDAKKRLSDKSKADAGSKIFCIKMDSSNVQDIRTSFAGIVELLRKHSLTLDILVNNAGILTRSAYHNMKDEEFSKVIDTNLKGYYFLAQSVSDYMTKNGIKGNILNIASSSSLRPAISPYTISKWGVRGFTVGLAKVLAPYGITVNGLAPGPTATPMLKKDDNINHKTSPAGRYVTAAEIANLAVFLVSDLGKMIIGDIVYMTGGCGVVTVDDMGYSF